MGEPDSMEKLLYDCRRINKKKMRYNKLEETRIKEIAETVSKYFELAKRKDYEPKITLVRVRPSVATNNDGL